jgi:hypothetical protein
MMWWSRKYVTKRQLITQYAAVNNQRQSVDTTNVRKFTEPLFQLSRYVHTCVCMCARTDESSEYE